LRIPGFPSFAQATSSSASRRLLSDATSTSDARDSTSHIGKCSAFHCSRQRFPQKTHTFRSTMISMNSGLTRWRHRLQLGGDWVVSRHVSEEVLLSVFGIRAISFESSGRRSAAGTTARGAVRTRTAEALDAFSLCATGVTTVALPTRLEKLVGLGSVFEIARWFQRP
jgi:hypothetical protein